MRTRVFSPTYPTWALVGGLQGQPAKLYLLCEVWRIPESRCFLGSEWNLIIVTDPSDNQHHHQHLSSVLSCTGAEGLRVEPNWGLLLLLKLSKTTANLN